jgi:hypothetical protein
MRRPVGAVARGAEKAKDIGQAFCVEESEGEMGEHAKERRSSKDRTEVGGISVGNTHDTDPHAEVR